MGSLYGLTKLTQNYEKGKTIVSLIHATFIFSYVFWTIYFSLQTDERMIKSVLFSFSYLMIDSFVNKSPRHISIYIHHILVSIGELYSLYSGTYPIAFYTYLGESFSVFLHIRTLTTISIIKTFSEIGVVITCFFGRIILSIYCWIWVLKTEDKIALGIYTGYILLNFYWGGIILGKLRKKLL